MCGTPRDQSPEDWTGPLEDGVGPIFLQARAQRKRVKIISGLEKKGNKYLCVFGYFRPFAGYFIFAEKILFMLKK